MEFTIGQFRTRNDRRLGQLAKRKARHLRASFFGLVGGIVYEVISDKLICTRLGREQSKKAIKPLNCYKLKKIIIIVITLIPFLFSWVAGNTFRQSLQVRSAPLREWKGDFLVMVKERMWVHTSGGRY